MGGPLFPVFLDLRGKRCLVVGGGKVGLRRAGKLLAAGAWVRLVAPVLGSSPPKTSARLTVHRRPFRPSDLKGVRLVFACTNDPRVNAAVVRRSRRLGLWANRADARDSDFILPAVATRRGVMAAFSTLGRSPSLARRLRIEWSRPQRRTKD